MIPILEYHQVTNIPRRLDPLGLATPPEQFERQMHWLAKNGYRCLSLSDAVACIQNSMKAPSRSLVITFDDGYQDLHSTAWPILDRYGFTATVFLVAGQMGSPGHWWGQEGDRSSRLLTWAEARALARWGITCGSHTISHPWLNLLDDQAAFEEIQNSKTILQEQLGMPVKFFSYPYSYTDDRVRQFVQTAGYTAACAGDIGPCDLFHLWRVPCVRGDTALSFMLKASGWYNKRTALRETLFGRLLRRGVRKLRRKATSHYYPSQPQAPVNDAGRASERGS